MAGASGPYSFLFGSSFAFKNILRRRPPITILSDCIASHHTTPHAGILQCNHATKPPTYMFHIIDQYYYTHFEEHTHALIRPANNGSIKSLQTCTNGVNSIDSFINSIPTLGLFLRIVNKRIFCYNNTTQKFTEAMGMNKL